MTSIAHYLLAASLGAALVVTLAALLAAGKDEYR
jgi:hypothetical protein